MKINIILFAVAREITGQNNIEIDVPEGATISELKSALTQKFPALKTIVERSAFSINHEYAVDSQLLPDHAEIGMIPPVSGG